MNTGTILGINRTSDASMAVASGGAMQVSIAKERLSRTKHAWGKLGDVTELYAPIVEPFGTPELIVECYGGDLERCQIGAYHRELDALWPGVPKIEVSHHLTHVYSAFVPSGFERAAALVVDFQGSPAALIEDSPAGVSPIAVEVLSTFTVARGSAPQAISRQLEPQAPLPHGLGSFYSALKTAIVPGSGTEGIVMGLSSLGDPDRLGLGPLEVDGAMVRVPGDWVTALAQGRERYGFISGGGGTMEEAADLAAAGQRAFEEALLDVARWLKLHTNERVLVYAGGCALNCAANERLRNESGFDEVWIPPAPHDGGTALGCVLYGSEKAQIPVDFTWTNDFLGPTPDCTDALATATSDEALEVSRPSDLAAEVGTALHGGDLVALFQGSSESGPRALGHRSILGNARYAVVRDFINKEVKQRQWFRPLAPMVQVEHVADWFHCVGDSPFMLRAVAVRDDAKPRIPAVVHHDGSARIQTVTRHDNELVWGVLDHLRRRSGVGVMLNTSLNGPRQPIVETADQALDFFLSVPVRHLVIGDHLITKRAAPAHPLRS